MFMNKDKNTPVSPSKLKVRGGRKVNYKGQTYLISRPAKSTRKGKKYMVTVQNKSTGKKKLVHWGALGYSDFYQHKDQKRRERFWARHKAIKTKSGEPAHLNPMAPAYYAVRGNW